MATSENKDSESTKPQDQTPAAGAFAGAEVTLLNLEIETLKWQLAQTEANRQMNLALLRQIVAFLNRVKEYLDLQKETASDEVMSERRLPRLFHHVDMPRSRSVVHVNKTLDFSLSPPSKLNSKKNLKSTINSSELNELKNWSQSKMSLMPEINSGKKISEEITRLITLANTVISTKLPELAVAGINIENNTENVAINETKEEVFENKASVKRENVPHIFTMDTCGTSDVFDGLTNKYIGINDERSEKHLTIPSSLTSGFENDFAAMDLVASTSVKNVQNASNATEKNKTKNNKAVPEKRSDNVGHLFEDESGFSSMSSFQEIGIPIINIIPPTPSDDEECTGALNIVAHNGDSWKTTDSSESGKNVKVFWV